MILLYLLVKSLHTLRTSIGNNLISLYLPFQSPIQSEILASLKRRLEQTSVPEFPRHRLRMLSKLSEGAFGTVSSL